MKKTEGIFIIFILLFLIPLSVSAVGINFKDVPRTHWAFDAINKLAQMGVIRGFPNNTFKPDAKVTREQFAITLTRYFNFDLNEKACRTFSDINYNHRSFLYIDAAKSFIPVHNKIGFIFDFNPSWAVTREDAAHAIVAALELNKAQHPNKNILPAIYKDYNNISPALQQSVATAAYYGILSGDNNRNFRPKAGLSRGELCAIFNNLTQREANFIQ